MVLRLWDEAIPEPGGVGPDAAVPSARGQQAEQFVAAVQLTFFFWQTV